MNIFNASRSVALWLFIIFFSINFVKAQSSSKNTDKPIKNFQNESAQIEEPTEYSTKPNEIGFWGGTSTIHKDLRGESAGGNFQMAGFRFAHRMIDGKSVKLKYVLDLIPVAVLNYPRERPFQTAANTVEIVRDRKTVYGLGFAPGGLQLNFRNRKKYQPFIGGAVGIMYLTSVTPDLRTPLQPRETGAKLNFTADVGAGLEIGLKKNRNFIIGYKYHHLSNLYTGNINVGFNSNFVYAGMNFGY